MTEKNADEMCWCGHPFSMHRKPDHYNPNRSCMKGGLNMLECNCADFMAKTTYDEIQKRLAEERREKRR